MPSCAKPQTIRNFGGNLAFSPEHHEVARDEAEVLQILQRHRHRQLRAHGSLHSWSQVAVCNEVSVDVSQLNWVQLNTETPNPTASVGAGCRIKQLLAELNLYGWTTPTLGLIKEQSLAGATATATHGSGRHCLSHYICQMRLATYDPAGNPVVLVVSSDEELRAACCALGSMGIVTEVTIPLRRQYWIEEHFREWNQLEDVIAAEDDYPLQQFFLIPWRWTYLVQHRRETQGSRSWHAPFYRAFWALGMDHGLHWAIIAIARWLPGRVGHYAFRHLLPRLVPRGWRVVDRSDRQLTMQHHLYRHIETELFVKASQLPQMLDVTQWLIQWCAGREPSGCETWADAIAGCGMAPEFDQLRGCYQHHYPICIRKVLADRGLITMSGSDDDEAWYAVSLISYASPAKRAGFLQFASAITRLAIHLFSARPHWGKHYPLAIPLHDLYVNYPRFLEIRNRLDPTDAFLPAWIAHVGQSLRD